ncbi:hypothetical protein SUGI_1163940 [Cryptomeria japonica]|nr:hypothetical protein SUGI_1163940 [Cryptomeria japonica]
MAVDLIEEIKKLLNEYRDKQDCHAIDVLQQLKVREKSSVDIVCNEIFSLVCDQVDAAVILKIMSRKDRKDQHVKDANNERLSIKCNSNKAAWSPGKYAHRRWWKTEDFRTEQGARIVYFDGRLPDIAHIFAKEASERQLPIFVDAERLREGLDELLNVATYVVCSANFPQAWTEAPSIASALVAIALKLPHLKFVIVTRGEEGSEPLELGLGCHTAAICV